jgi:hypothetical protein
MTALPPNKVKDERLTTLPRETEELDAPGEEEVRSGLRPANPREERTEEE